MLSSRFILIFSLALSLGLTLAADAQVSKGHQILLKRGFQIQGLSINYDNFHLETFSNANYTAVTWLWDSDTSQHGSAPGFPWAKWVGDESKMPPQGNETNFMSQLVALQLADEWNLNDDATRTRLVNWFSAVRNNFPNTILYHNSFGGQVGDTQLGDFYTRAHPDMLCFDTYPWHSDYDINRTNHTGAIVGGTPVHWYSELRRYREHARVANIPFAIYRQTFHAVQDYDSQIFRDPSPSELRLNTFAALAFNAKMLIDFTYNTGASSLFTGPGGDSFPNALYTELQDANRRARNLGRALVCLKPVDDLHNPAASPAPAGPASDNKNFPPSSTTGILFLKGAQISGGTTNTTPLPISFYNDPDAPNSYSWWEFGKNDPYLTGWSVTNKTRVKNNGLPGEVIISWFKPLDESFDGKQFNNQVYMMVVNGLTATDGTAADCLQEIKLNFRDTSATAKLVMLDAKSGRLQTNALPIVSKNRQLVLNLNGGDAALFKFNTGAPFVGFTNSH